MLGIKNILNNLKNIHYQAISIKNIFIEFLIGFVIAYLLLIFYSIDSWDENSIATISLAPIIYFAMPFLIIKYTWSTILLYLIILFIINKCSEKCNMRIFINSLLHLNWATMGLSIYVG